MIVNIQQMQMKTLVVTKQNKTNVRPTQTQRRSYNCKETSTVTAPSADF